MVNSIETIDLLLILAWLVAYMYLAGNFMMIAMERKIQLSVKDWKASVSQILALLDRTDNPDNYISARVHLVGAALLILAPMAVSLVRNA